MLGHWPPGFPDETLYSLFSRYKGRMFFTSNSDVCQDLFGTHITSTGLEFPLRLNYLQEQLPPEFDITSEALIWSHTPLAFYAPFTSPERITAAVSAMQGTDPKANGKCPRQMIAAPLFLRYCVDCAKDDRRDYHEAYWHRIHQFGCIPVCAIHNCWLVDSKVRRAETFARKFIAADDVVDVRIHGRKIRRDSDYELVLLWLARQATWLLNNPRLTCERKERVAVYNHHIIRTGYASPTGMLSPNSQFNHDVEHSIPEPLVRELDRPYRNTAAISPWPIRVAKGHWDFPPIFHLLLLRFLGLDAQSFLEQVHNPPAPEYFERGPWPCLNPTCKFCNQNILDKYEVRVADKGRFFGIFTCSCGYSYSRKAPDLAGETRTKPFRVEATGEKWDAALREHWADSNVGVSTLATLLQSNSHQIKRAVVRLGLPLQRNGEPLKPAPVGKKEAMFESLLNKHRQSFLSFVKTHPNFTLRKSPRKMIKTIRWLRRYDRAWYRLNALKRRYCTSGGKSRIDWDKRDRELANEVFLAREELLKEEERPIRISKVRLLRQMGQRQGWIGTASKLPKTLHALDRAVESLGDSMIRRLIWVVREACAIGDSISLSQALEEANIRPKQIKDATTKKALAVAIRDLGLDPLSNTRTVTNAHRMNRTSKEAA